MITPLQILSKVILTRDNSIIENNGLTVEFFPQYESEYSYIQEHIKEYGTTPDKLTFLSKFPDTEIGKIYNPYSCSHTSDYVIKENNHKKGRHIGAYH